MNDSEIKTDVLSPESGQDGRYKEIFELVGGDEKLAFELYASGKSVDEVRAEFAGKMRQESKDGKPDKDSWSSKFWAAVERRMKGTKCSKGDAIHFVVAERPQLHEAFLRELRTPPKPEFTEFWNKVKEYRDKMGCGEGEAIRACFAKYPELVDFWAAVKFHMTETKCGEAEAVHFCVKEHPDLHEQFLQSQAKTKAHDVTSESEQPAMENRDGKPATWDAAIKQQMKADTSDSGEISKRAAAIRFCVHQYPDLHKAFIEGQRQG